MLVTFKSKSAADVPMYPEHAQMLLSLVGKSLEPPQAPKGIITAGEVPAALAALKSASTASKRDPKGERDDDPERPLPVGLAQRAFPLIDMLERAAKEGRDVVWGV